MSCKMRSSLILEFERAVRVYSDATWALAAAVGIVDFNQLKRDTVSKRLEGAKTRDVLDRHLKACDCCSIDLRTLSRGQKRPGRTRVRGAIGVGKAIFPRLLQMHQALLISQGRKHRLSETGARDPSWQRHPGGDAAIEIDFHDPIVVCVGKIDGAILVDVGVGRELVSLA